jgi:hypothetical protein
MSIEDCSSILITQLLEKLNINEEENITNKGTGAGGANTNKSGLPYEELTELKQKYTIIKSNKYHKIIKFLDSDKEFKMSKQSGFFKCMNDKINNKIEKAHGCKNPDECFIDEETKKIFIIEKKFQQVSGSVCEKIQTPDFKIWQYSRTFPEYKIIYIYCLSDWFKENCKAELEYLKHKKIPVFWGIDTEYKDKIVKFIINYKDNS